MSLFKGVPLANIPKISTSSKFPPDKIVQEFSGSFNAATAPKINDPFSGFPILSKFKIPHGFTRPVFTKLKWSLDGITWLDGGFSRVPTDPNQIQTTSMSDSTDIGILSIALTGTIYYEVICFWIDDYDGTNPLVPSFLSPNKEIAYDSRDNYQKVFDQDEVTVSGTSDSGSIVHNLNYTPNTWVYFEAFPGEVWLAAAGGVGNVFLYDYDYQGELEVTITDTTIDYYWLAGMLFSGSARIWYKIYLDQ